MNTSKEALITLIIVFATCKIIDFSSPTPVDYALGILVILYLIMSIVDTLKKIKNHPKNSNN